MYYYLESESKSELGPVGKDNVLAPSNLFKSSFM